MKSATVLAFAMAVLAGAEPNPSGVGATPLEEPAQLARRALGDIIEGASLEKRADIHDGKEVEQFAHQRCVYQADGKQKCEYFNPCAVQYRTCHAYKDKSWKCVPYKPSCAAHTEFYPK